MVILVSIIYDQFIILGRRDFRSWDLKPSKGFSNNSFPEALVFSFIWNVKISRKVKFIAWKVVVKRVNI